MSIINAALQPEDLQINRAVELVAHNKEQPWEACRLASRPIPSAPPGHVVLRLLCRTVNPADVNCIRGFHRNWLPPSLPAVVGLEAMGVIHQIGEGVRGFEVGQRVFPMMDRPELSGQGLWQDYIVAPMEVLVPIPASVPDEAAAQFFLNPWTVIGLMEVLKVPKGDYVLQTAAASALGRMVIQYARSLGVKTINVVRSKDHVEELRALGADEVIVSTHEDVLERVKSFTGGMMVHSALDCVGGDSTTIVVKCVRDGGTVVIFGALVEMFARVAIEDFVFRDIKIRGFYLFTWLKSLSPRDIAETSGLVMKLLERKTVMPAVGEKFLLQDFKDAIKRSMVRSSPLPPLLQSIAQEVLDKFPPNSNFGDCANIILSFYIKSHWCIPS